MCPSDATDPMALLDQAPLFGRFQGRMGIVFRGEIQVISELFDISPFLEDCPENIIAPQTSESEVVFLSVRAIFAPKTVNPTLEVVPADAVTFFTSHDDKIVHALSPTSTAVTASHTITFANSPSFLFPRTTQTPSQPLLPSNSPPVSTTITMPLASTKSLTISATQRDQTSKDIVSKVGHETIRSKTSDGQSRHDADKSKSTSNERVTSMIPDYSYDDSDEKNAQSE
jgi:hypothetical protein